MNRKVKHSRIALRYALSILCIIPFFHVSAQESPLQALIQRAKSENVNFQKWNLLTYAATLNVVGKGDYHELELNKADLDSLLQNKPEAIEISLPVGNGKFLDVELIKQDLGNPFLKENNSSYRSDIIQPMTYRGTVKDTREKSIITLTVNNDFISVLVALHDKNLMIEKDSDPLSDKIILLNTSEIDLPLRPLDCGTVGNTSQQQHISTETPNAPQDKCVYVFVECFDSLYQWRNSNYQETIDYVYALFNSVAAGYLNEQINIKISTINVWTVQDPYRQDNLANALADLANNYRDNYWGNICVGLDFSIGLPAGLGRTGRAGAIGRVKGEAPNFCGSYAVGAHSFCYNDLNYNVNVQNFPTGTNVTQQQVFLVMHEIGHLLGSPHTHACTWQIQSNPPAFGALDNCANPEGTCPPGPPPPASGGTIMSYCVSAGRFVNFNNGFGPLPGNAIRNFVDASVCIPNCVSCYYDLTIGNLGNGPNRFEVSNSIIANGNLPPTSITVFDAGNSIRLLPGFRANNGAILKVLINGCGGIR